MMRVAKLKQDELDSILEEQESKALLEGSDFEQIAEVLLEN
jgi:hypothetical protein